MNEPKKNRLAAEKSPYLKQHAENPVDWYPWGEEAFAKAAAEDKPIFLSIGYSTCHWCHVMAHESFEDPEIAALMNDAFVNIKVDREERPDIDDIYMAVCQLLTGSGGWPLTIIMTPDKRPFFAGTYIPPTSRQGRLGMVELVPRVGKLWRTERAKAESTAATIVTHLQQMAAAGAPGGPLDRQHFKATYTRLEQLFDRKHGGFAHQPKFPLPHKLTFLLRYWRRTGQAQALEMVTGTLRAMRAGGLCDQVGFGFHRYSTDREWLVPHFEKMLYDQAQLAIAYLEAHQATDEDEFARTAREIFAYVRRDLTSPEGAFFSAEDADSEGEEGKFYVFTTAELEQVLGQGDAVFAAEVFGARPGGNHLEEATGRPTRANILHRRFTMGELAERTGLAPAELERRLVSIRRRLFEYRAKRVRPHRDEKILTDWNGLMIAALARGSRVLGDPEPAAAAARAAAFIDDKLTDAQGRLLHRYAEGAAAIPAFLDDYAFYAWGLLELYEAAFDPSHLRRAIALVERMLAAFADPAGGFFFTATDAEKLLVRRKDLTDGALPAGNSVALLVLIKLARLTGRADFEFAAEQLIAAFATAVRETPGESTMFLGAVDFVLGPSSELVIAGDPEAEDTRALVRVAQTVYQPSLVLALRPTDVDAPPIVELASFTAEQGKIDGRAAAYLCTGRVCRTPLTDPEALRAALAKL
jgi:uncharacterized protein